MRSTRLLAAVTLASIVALTGCDKARPLPAPADPTQGCLGCHGGQDNQTGAPPWSLPRNAAGVIQSGGTRYGNEATTSQVAVGAHTRHLSRGVSCGACHVVPVMISSPGHNTGQQATVTFKELAAANNVVPAAWVPAVHTCANYCHGPVRSASGPDFGGSNHAPDWLGGVTGSCVTCHFGPGQVPPAQHPQGIGGAGFATSKDCAACHTETVSASTGEINVTGGKHVNGQLDGGGGHPPGWADPVAHGPAANAGLQACAVCHGSGFDGGTSGVSCNACHATNGHPSWQTECTFCHGSPARAANPAFPNAGSPAVRSNLASPPVGSQGETNTTAYAVGAHDSHASGGALASATQCLECHGPTLPANVAHVNGTVAIAWGPVASAAGTNSAPAAGNVPRWNDATLPAGGANCTNYCHGASLDGGALTSPKWNEGASGAFCGSCHGLPLPYTAKGKWHVPRSDCGSCHPGYSGTAVVASTHVDGVANLGTLSCTSCHGSAANAAPPSDVTGAASGGNAIGAHQKHVAGVTLHQGNFACGECHATPTTLLHANGSINILWGATAAAGGYAVVPANGGFTRGAAFPNCTNHCHDPNKADTAATNKAPTWTGVPGSVTCGSCHGLPPQGTGHTTSATCSGCHQGYADAPTAASTASAVSLVNHINGVTDLAGGGSLTCTSCHGTAGRVGVGTADPLQPAAPPAAATSTNAVGAHLAHVNQGATAPALSSAFRCVNCHNPIPATIPHTPYPANPVAFGNLATAASAAPLPYAQATQTCSNTYCHGQFSGGTNNNSVTWGAAGKLACTACHGVPAAYPHPQNATCASCHTGYTASTVAAATHVDGLVTKSTFGCSACHGVLTTANPGVPAATPLNAAPGAGGTGLATTGAPVAATTPEYGAHQAHLQQANFRSASLACSDCHAVPAAGDVAHATGTGTGGARATLTWSALARGAVNTVWTTAVVPSYSRTGSVGCTATYCHGNFTNGKGAVTVVWAQNAALDCNSCHGAGTGATATPPGGTHPNNTSCGTCHTGYTGTTVAAATHIDGQLQVVAQSCTGCHLTAQPMAAGGTRRAIVPEFANAWSHKRSASPTGTVTDFDCAVCHMEGEPATGKPVPGVHQDGVINLRDPDTGNNIQGVTFGGTGAGAYTSSGTNMTFTRFSRNLGSNVIEPEVAAIMINQCLRCHDANGALSPLARVPTTGTAEKPFGTTIAGTAYTGVGVTANGVTGGVANVNESFKVTNSSYHPVTGKQNNWYAKLTRMVAPWNTATRGGTVDVTSWGPLISCWDCHAPPAATGTITYTVTAHGVAAANYMRGAPAATGTTPTPAVTLCNRCHALYNTCGTAADQCASFTSHGPNSAFSSNPNRSTKTPYLRTGCNMCHSSGYTTPVARPIRAQDVHGVNAVIGTGTRSGRWSGGADTRPYAFIRNLNQLADHAPARIGATNYGGACDMRSSPCSQGVEVYSAGGTY